MSDIGGQLLSHLSTRIGRVLGGAGAGLLYNATAMLSKCTFPAIIFNATCSIELQMMRTGNRKTDIVEV